MLVTLQLSSLAPYYRSVKVNSIKTIVEQITLSIQEDNANAFTEDVFDLSYNNQLCMTFYSESGVEIFNADSLGVGCYINQNQYDKYGFLESIYLDEMSEKIEYVNNPRFENEMIIYGTKISSNLGSYYLVMNAQIEPVDSTVFIIQNQFIYISIFTLAVASFVSLIMSNRLSRPIIKMTKSAKQFAGGNHEVSFEYDGLSEVDELAYTLNFAKNEMEKTDELRRDLIANVSHDIKTPLTMIKAYAEMIQDISGNNPEKREEHLKVIIHEANHLDRLVSDMLELSKLQSGNMVLNKTNFNLVEVTESIISLFDGLLIKEGITIELIYPTPMYVNADEVKIGQVVYNFINNAIKYVGEDKKIIVKIAAKDEKTRLSVIDHGIGIAKENQKMIWDRYQKINKGHHRASEGSGLGLSISKGILHAHNAKYGVKSTVKKGSTFWFEL